MKHLKALIVALALALCVIVHAQTTTVTATNLKIGGYPISTGVVYFTPVGANGNPIPFADATGALNSPEAFEGQITNGAIVGALTETNTVGGTFAVPDATLTTPANIPYNVMVCDKSTGLRTSGLCYTLPRIVGVSGATWALDHYGPPNVTTTASIQVATGTTVPTSCVPPSFWYNSSTAALEACVGNVFVAPPGSGGSGTAATVQVGTTTTGAPGTSAAVTNSGSSSAAVFNFAIPQGATGATGATGARGPAGADGAAVTPTTGDLVASTAASGTLTALHRVVATYGLATLTYTESACPTSSETESLGNSCEIPTSL